jgi:hypothetical protein
LRRRLLAEPLDLQLDVAALVDRSLQVSATEGRQAAARCASDTLGRLPRSFDCVTGLPCGLQCSKGWPSDRGHCRSGERQHARHGAPDAASSTEKSLCGSADPFGRASEGSFDSPPEPKPADFLIVIVAQQIRTAEHRNPGSIEILTVVSARKSPDPAAERIRGRRSSDAGSDVDTFLRRLLTERQLNMREGKTNADVLPIGGLDARPEQRPHAVPLESDPPDCRFHYETPNVSLAWPWRS